MFENSLGKLSRNQDLTTQEVTEFVEAPQAIAPTDKA